MHMLKPLFLFCFIFCMVLLSEATKPFLVSYGFNWHDPKILVVWGVGYMYVLHGSVLPGFHSWTVPFLKLTICV